MTYCIGVLDQGSVKPTTATRYRVSLRQIDPYFRSLPLPAITMKVITTFITARQKEGTTNATIRRDLTIISRVLAYAAANGMVERNIMADYDRNMLREARRQISAPDDATIARAIELVSPEWGLLVRWLRDTGMRLGEALRAERAHVHGRDLTIHQTKSGRPRTIELPDWFEPPKAGYLLPDLHRDVNTASNGWAHLRRKIKAVPRFRLHDLRHAYAIAEIRAGRDIYDLSRHLGHSSVKVTEIYLGYAKGRSAVSRR